MGIFVSLCSGFSVKAEIRGEDIFGRKNAMFSEEKFEGFREVQPLGGS